MVVGYCDCTISAEYVRGLNDYIYFIYDYGYASAACTRLHFAQCSFCVHAFDIIIIDTKYSTKFN